MENRDKFLILIVVAWIGAAVFFKSTTDNMFLRMDQLVELQTKHVDNVNKEFRDDLKTLNLQFIGRGKHLRQAQKDIITNVNYDEPSGIATITTKEAHNLDVTNPVTLAGIAFTCSGSTGITTTIFPDPQQSYVVDTVIGDVGTSKTFSAVVGSSKGYPHFYNSAIHFYERSRANAVEVGTGTTGGYTSFTASPGTTYNPNTGILGITTASHGLSVGDLIRIDDEAITFTCSQDGNSTNHPYPRATDPALSLIHI